MPIMPGSKSIHPQRARRASRASSPHAYLPLPPEENPALGLRGLRTSLWQPALLHTQLRAILRVQPLEQCRILLPMITDVAEVQSVRQILDELCRQLGCAMPPLGVMIETPASALIASVVATTAACNQLSGRQSGFPISKTLSGKSSASATIAIAA